MDTYPTEETDNCLLFVANDTMPRDNDRRTFEQRQAQAEAFVNNTLAALVELARTASIVEGITPLAQRVFVNDCNPATTFEQARAASPSSCAR
jgi:hypothetical protein